jgi:hypothetical protein
MHREASYARVVYEYSLLCRMPLWVSFLGSYRAAENGFYRGSGGFTWKVLQPQVSYGRKLLPENRLGKVPLPRATELTEKVVPSSVITGSS